MSYIVIKKGSGKKPYKIIRKDTGKVVGSSSTKAKAYRSIGYREEAEMKKESGMMMKPVSAKKMKGRMKRNSV